MFCILHISRSYPLESQAKKMRQKKKKKNWGWQLSSWQMFFFGGWEMSEFGGGKCPNFGGGKCPPGKWLTIENPLSHECQSKLWKKSPQASRTWIYQFDLWVKVQLVFVCLWPNWEWKKLVRLWLWNQQRYMCPSISWKIHDHNSEIWIEFVKWCHGQYSF